MKKREKLLLAGLVAVLVVWQGQPVVNALFFAPISSREARVEALQSAISDKEVRERELTVAKGKLKEWAERSLPPDPVEASALYQNWLIELCQQTKLADFSVAMSSVTRAQAIKGTYYPVKADIKAQATLDVVCSFLHEFRRAGLLQRINSVQLTTARHDANPKLEVLIQVEALALASSPKRATLFVDPAAPPTPETAPPERSHYEPITAKNLFVKGYTGPAAPPRRGPPSPTDDFPPATELVFLTGFVASGDRLTAFLYDRSTGSHIDLVAGGDFRVAGLEGKVVAIGPDHITLEIKGETLRLELGENLKQMKKLAEPASPATARAGS